MKSGKKWFIDRTTEHLDRRAVPYSPDSLIGSPCVLPTFWSKSFLFEADEEPDHRNAVPFFSTQDDMYEVLEMQGEVATLLAADVASLSMASLLAQARVRRVERALPLFRRSDDIVILRPDNEQLLMYKGREL